MTQMSSRMPSSKRSATKKPRSRGCAPARRTSPTWAAFFRPTTSISPSAAPGEVTKTLAALRASPATARAKAKFILATDGADFEAEDLASGETRRLRLQRLSRPFRLLPAAGRHHHRQADPRKLVRHPGDQPPEPALCRTSEGQPRMGHGRAPPRHESLHGAADLLLLRRGHRHLHRQGPVHRHDRADERAGLVQHP